MVIWSWFVWPWVSCLRGYSACSAVSLPSGSQCASPSFTWLKSLSEKQTGACHSCLKYPLAYVASKMVSRIFDSNIRVQHISPVLFTSRLPCPLTLSSSHSRLTSASFTSMLCLFLILSSEEAPHFLKCLLPSIQPSIHPRMVMFAGIGPGVGYRMLNKLDNCLFILELPFISYLAHLCSSIS